MSGVRFRQLHPSVGQNLRNHRRRADLSRRLRFAYGRSRPRPAGHSADRGQPRARVVHRASADLLQLLQTRSRTERVRVPKGVVARILALAATFLQHSRQLLHWVQRTDQGQQQIQQRIFALILSLLLSVKSGKVFIVQENIP